MFQSITFYVGEKTLGIYGEEFPLGTLTTEVLKKIIKKEEPDSILPTLGGQAALNLAMELDESGFLVENRVRMIGTSSASAAIR